MARFWPTAQQLRVGLNLWPPLLGAGIRVRTIAPDFRSVTVSLRLSPFNKNHAGTHFGGSLFAMTDPFFALMLLNNLGPGYLVWDRAAHIEFKAPARGVVTARFAISDDDVTRARQCLAGGEKYEPTFSVDICDAQGTVVATVARTLYLRRKPAHDGARSARDQP